MTEQIQLVAKYDPSSPRENSFRLPRPLPVDTLLQIVLRFKERLPFLVGQPLHIIGVASGGDQVATAIAIYLKEQYPQTPIWLSSVNLKKPINIIRSPAVKEGKLHTIVIDNSIVTGRTMESVLDLLKEKQVKAGRVVQLVKYGDRLSVEVEKVLKRTYGVEIERLFDIEEIEVCNDPR